jgi:tRNA 2-thiouridine synthesizing protein A
VSDGPEPAPDAVVDALGLLCPLPVLRCRQALGRLPPGSVVALLADDDEIARDLPAFCEGSGHELLSLRRDGSAWRGLVRSGSRMGPPRPMED